MNFQIFLKMYRWIFFIPLFAMASCNQNDDKKAGNTPAADSSKPVLAGPVMAALTSGALDTLFIDSTAFVKLDNEKVVFSFTFRGNDTLTLHGWSLKNNPKQFDSLPNIKLVKARADKTLTYGLGTYFGNVVLSKKGVEDVKDALDKKHAQFVLFAPRKYGENIGYDIFVGKDNPAVLVKIFVVDPTGASTNPSPPKPY